MVEGSETQSAPTGTAAPGASADRAPDRSVARAQREVEARAALRPLGRDEWPMPLRVAIGVAVALAIGVLVGTATIHDLSGHGGSQAGGAFIAVVLLALACAMYRRRYWAVLSFEALLAFQIVVTSLALVVAETLLAAGLCLLSIGLSGWLFWKLVRVMGRMRAESEGAGGGAEGAEESPGLAGEGTDEALR